MKIIKDKLHNIYFSMWASIIFASLVAVSSGIPQYSSPPPPSYIAPAPACDPVTVTETTTEYGEVVVSIFLFLFLFEEVEGKY